MAIRLTLLSRSFNIEEGRRKSLAEEARKAKDLKEGKKEKAIVKAGDTKIGKSDNEPTET